MGRVLTQNNKVKFEINDKQDCISYLGHVIEYIEKKKDVYLNLSLEALSYLKYVLETKDIHLDGFEEVMKFIKKETNTDFDFDIDFYKFKLFNSSINLMKNEIINIVGDFSADKLAISYNNYLDIIYKKKIQGVKYECTREKRALIDYFNTERNFMYHFSSDKLCEWIKYREEQVKKYKNVEFEFGKELNIYISNTITYKVFVSEISNNLAFLNEVDKVISFMKKDFENLIGEKVTINIKKGEFDNSAKDITYNGFESHKLSKDRNNK